MAFFMAKTPAPTKASTINETMELLWNTAVISAPPATPPRVFLLTRCKKKFKITSGNIF
jgi:hypothetical protein